MAENNPDRVVLITGAASGIGAAVCRRIAGPGCSLVLHTRGSQDSRRQDLEAVAQQAEKAGSPVLTLFGDLSEDGLASGLVEQSLVHFGRLDQIVSNAGFADRRPLGEVDRETLDRSLRAMPGAFFDLVTAALPTLQDSAWGRVVAVSSFVAHVYAADGLFPATAAAKAGLESLAKSLAVQLAPTGATVNCVVPGYTRKDATGHSALSEEGWQRAIGKTPNGRIAEPDDHAAAVSFLLSRDASHITGQVIHVDGGLTLA
ncbi:MAG: SDR family oxidoreductase [Rhodospirillales bacterium]|nr:SDR family oxidoreductase [Rhodospirillales bacterium]